MEGTSKSFRSYVEKYSAAKEFNSVAVRGKNVLT